MIDLDATERRLLDGRETPRYPWDTALALVAELRTCRKEIERRTFTADVNWDLAQIYRLENDSLKAELEALSAKENA